MNTSILCRLFYLGCELHPFLPSDKLMNLLGKTWSKVIKAGCEHGFVGSQVALPKVSVTQIENMYMNGSESGATPTLKEFNAILSNEIYSQIHDLEASSQEKMSLTSSLNSWFEGMQSRISDSEMDFGAEVDQPMFSTSGFWPLDKVSGKLGIPSDIITLLAKPAVGKTTIGLSVCFSYRRLDLGAVTYCQTEIPPAAMAYKRNLMAIPGENLFRPGIDRMVFGANGTLQYLDKCIAEKDSTRLIIIDSVPGMCGQGDSSESRNRYAELYMKMMQVLSSQSARFIIATTHPKRGQEVLSIESAGGSSVIERLSGLIVTAEKEDIRRPDGLGEIIFGTVKNRWQPAVRPFTFGFDYVTGRAINLDEGEDVDYELETTFG